MVQSLGERPHVTSLIDIRAYKEVNLLVDIHCMLVKAVHVNRDPLEKNVCLCLGRFHRFLLKIIEANGRELKRLYHIGGMTGDDIAEPGRGLSHQGRNGYRPLLRESCVMEANECLNVSTLSELRMSSHIIQKFL